MPAPTVRFPDGAFATSLGQGVWNMGDSADIEKEEIEALRTGIKAGMTLIDTAELYGDGNSERLVAKAIQGMDRSSLFIVSKVLPSNAGKPNILKSCAESLKRLGTDYLDLYLLHWSSPVPLAEIVQNMEELKQKGWIRRWGVSNFDTYNMKKLWEVKNGSNCATNQVLYHLASRGIEFDLIPWMKERGIPVMAYCPLAQAGQLRRDLYSNSMVQKVAARHKATVSQILLAFLIRQGNIIAIPKSGKVLHTKENSEAANVVLSAEDLEDLDKAYPPPTRKLPLDLV